MKLIIEFREKGHLVETQRHNVSIVGISETKNGKKSYMVKLPNGSTREIMGRHMQIKDATGSTSYFLIGV